jgi:predicted DNA binding CopG/RHH family protein
MKLVPIDDDCKHKDPCEKEKAEIAKLKKELAKLQADNTKLRKDIENSEFMRECPEQEVKTIYKTKEVKVPVDRVVEKSVDRVVEKETERGLSFGLMGAYAQDGLSTSSSAAEEYAVDAYVYKSFIAGPYINIPIGKSFELGAFGMFGGVNQTIGGKIGYMFK